MALTAVVPNIFYDDLDIGFAFFCDALRFRNAYRADDDGLCIVPRDGACFHLCVNAGVAKQDRPEFRIAADDIEAYHREIVAQPIVPA